MDEQTPSDKPQKSFPKYLLILFGVVLGFVLLIGIDRILGILLYRTGYFTAMMKNTSIVYNTVEFNTTAKLSSQGLRNEKVTIPKPHNTYRILTLGDSFTFGWGVNVDQTWEKLLGQQLHLPGEKVEVINAGVPGFQLPGEIDVCKAYADTFDADAIIVGVYADDFSQEVVYDQYQSVQTIWAKIFPTLSALDKPVIEDQIWMQQPTPYQSVIYASDSWKQTAQQEENSNPDLVAKLDPTARQAFLAGKLSDLRVVIGMHQSNYELQILDKKLFSQGLTSYSNRLQEFQSSCAKNRPVMFVFLPAFEMVSKDAFPYLHKLGYSTNPQLTTINVDTPLAKVIQNHGYSYVSVLTKLRQMNCVDCFYHLDGHFTPLGERITADTIAPVVEGILTKKN